MSYAQALFNLAKEQNGLEEWLSLLEALQLLFTDHPKIFQFFTSPIVSIEEKENLLNRHFKPHLPQTMLNFLNHLLKKKQFASFFQIFQSYKKLVHSALGIAEGHIVTTTPLDQMDKELLNRIINKKIELKEEVDPTLIGGGILTIDGQRIDFSLKGKLERLKRSVLCG